MNRFQITQEIIEELCKLEAKKCIDFLDDKIRGSYPLLKYLCESKEEVSAGALSKVLNVSTARIAVMLCNLEFKKLVIKKKSEEDARITIVCITDKGKEFVEKTNEEIVNYFLKGFEKLEDEELCEIKLLIKKLQGGKDAKIS